MSEELNHLPEPSSDLPAPSGGLPAPSDNKIRPHAPKNYRKQVVTLEKGKLPPQAVDLEEVILGALMIDKKGLEIMPIMFVEMFYKEKHQHIYEAIEQLWENGDPIDLLTVSDRLKKNSTLVQVGGEFYLIQLTQKVSSSAHIEYHARIVMQQYVLRRAIMLGSVAIEDAYGDNPDIFEIIDYMQGDISDIMDKITRNATLNTSSVSEQVMDKRKRALEGQLLYLPSGVFKIDNHMSGGFIGSELTVIGARPGMGKTTVALALCKQFSIVHSFRGGFFTLEMPKVQVVNKLVAPRTGMPYSKIKAPQDLSPAEFKVLLDAYAWFEKECGLEVVDNVSTIPGIYNWVKVNKPQYIMVDYLQILELDSQIKKKAGNREQEVAYFSRSLKRIAKEFDIPVFAMSQLSRKVDDRAGGRPRLSDMRESGAIEQDADRIAFVVRPAYYQEADRVPDIEKGNTILDFAKDRDNGPKTFYIAFDMVELDIFQEYRLASGMASLPAPSDDNEPF